MRCYSITRGKHRKHGIKVTSSKEKHQQTQIEFFKKEEKIDKIETELNNEKSKRKSK